MTASNGLSDRRSVQGSGGARQGRRAATDIETEVLTACPLCGYTENSVLHESLKDRLFFAPGTWTFCRCNACGVAFLNPRPLPGEIHKAYTELYSTRKKAGHPGGPGSLRAVKRYLKRGYYAFKHGYTVGTTRIQRMVGGILSLMPVWGDRLSSAIMGIPCQPNGRLLDVGSGVGEMLDTMAGLGWIAEGVDTDPRVVEECRRRGLHVRLGTLEGARYPENHFHVVTSSHVIEHVYDPVGFLAEIRRVLKPGGRVYLRTPNLDSLGRRSFGDYWLGLEAPRHLYLFAHSTLQRVAELARFRTVRIVSTARTSRFIALVSRELRDHGRVAYRTAGSRDSRLGAFVHATRVRLHLLFGNDVGDELLLVAEK